MKRFLSLLGPGLLYAAAAIGVSHLVQSTRAGASFGFELMWVLLLANLLKFPFFEVGSRYVLATGKNLVDAYLAAGRWVLIAFLAMTIVTMIPVQAALTIVTAGLANYIFEVETSDIVMSAVLIAVTLLLLLAGRFNLMDRIVKFVIVLLTISTLVAVWSAAGKDGVSWSTLGNFDWANRTHILFLVAFVGWMPAPIDIVVWTSLWSQRKYDSMEQRPSLREALIEFRVGYFGTMIVAAAFLALGALVMHGSNQELEQGSAAFAAQLIGMYTHAIGNWAYPVITLAALTTMFSTTLTVMDAYPRTLTNGFNLLFKNTLGNSGRIRYLIWIFVLAAGTLLLLGVFGKSMRFMVDLATSISFVTAPVLALLNYKVITSPIIGKDYQPATYLKIWSWIGIVFLGLFTVFYLYVLLF